MKVKIAIPQTLDDYTIHQANNMLDFLEKNPGKLSVQKKIEMISIASGESVEFLRTVDMEAIKTLYLHVEKAIRRKDTLPPREVKINNVTYEFEQNLNHKAWTAGRYIDSDTNGHRYKDEPERLVAICYIEKGKPYGHTSIDHRAAIMREHFKGSHLVDLYAFFLRKFEQLTPGYSVLQIARSRIHTSEAIQLLKKTPKGG